MHIHMNKFVRSWPRANAFCNDMPNKAVYQIAFECSFCTAGAKRCLGDSMFGLVMLGCSGWIPQLPTTDFCELIDITPWQKDPKQLRAKWGKESSWSRVHSVGRSQEMRRRRTLLPPRIIYQQGDILSFSFENDKMSPCWWSNSSDFGLQMIKLERFWIAEGQTHAILDCRGSNSSDFGLQRVKLKRFWVAEGQTHVIWGCSVKTFPAASPSKWYSEPNVFPFLCIDTIFAHVLACCVLCYVEVFDCVLCVL